MKCGFEDISVLSKAAGDSLRLEVLRVLAQDSYGVQELCEIFDHKQSGMSHHLKVLAEAGLVSKRREGNSIFYSRSIPSVDASEGLVGESLACFQLALYEAIDSVHLGALTKTRLTQVQQSRADASKHFFAEQGHRFKEQQDLIAEYPVYGQAVTDLLLSALEKDSFSKAVEVGPGAGEFLPVLAQHFDEVLALDNASEMLAQAETYCRQQEADGIEFVVGDTAHLAQLPPVVECAVMNMVLHHTPSPADVINDLSVSLKSGGVLLITDLCRHDQDWAKSACGDLWLGFDAEELQRWCSSVGLVKERSQYLALRNGFQIQLQQFRKI